ncbi:sensor histidine kinase RegB [Yoonia sp. BS5-3]|uniref:histidine kinase n=1 Tax=Yoonia phaeophyticola TaxID=3137369 RepID=A0ABZ2V537_9RHOB
MQATEIQLFQEQKRSNWVRLRTLMTLRWFAIIGQAIAVFAAIKVYHLQINVGLPAVVIGGSVAANIFCFFAYPENRRLSEREGFVWLIFDIVQLSFLLFLTGGLNNPFAMLIMAPVTIAATVLHRSSTIVLGVLALLLLSLISRYHIPIVTADGAILSLPVLFQFGFWVALMISVVFLAIYARQVTTEMHTMGEALVATQLALAREQKLTDLGGVVAATAHELGTPLATIKLVSSELMEELSDHPDLIEDAELIRSQADRCRDILHSMGRAGKDDLHLKHAPIETVLRDAAEPHLDRGKEVIFDITPGDDGEPSQPAIPRRPEIIHGLRNLIQNAVDFARSEVAVSAIWSPEQITIRIADDGRGFPQSVIGRIGEPYVKRRRLSEDGPRRPGYDGMGLGLFIAKTLLERSGATLTFANGASGGAVIDVVWPRDVLSPVASEQTPALGENQPNDPWT